MHIASVRDKKYQVIRAFSIFLSHRKKSIIYMYFFRHKNNLFSKGESDYESIGYQLR